MKRHKEELCTYLGNSVFDSMAVAVAGGNAFLVYLVLRRFIWRGQGAPARVQPLIDEGHLVCTPSQEVIAKILDFSRPTVNKAVNRLVELGWVATESFKTSKATYLTYSLGRRIPSDHETSMEVYFVDQKLHELWTHLEAQAPEGKVALLSYDRRQLLTESWVSPHRMTSPTVSSITTPVGVVCKEYLQTRAGESVNTDRCKESLQTLGGGLLNSFTDAEGSRGVLAAVKILYTKEAKSHLEISEETETHTEEERESDARTGVRVGYSEDQEGLSLVALRPPTPALTGNAVASLPTSGEAGTITQTSERSPVGLPERTPTTCPPEGSASTFTGEPWDLEPRDQAGAADSPRSLSQLEGLGAVSSAPPDFDYNPLEALEFPEECELVAEVETGSESYQERPQPPPVAPPPSSPAPKAAYTNGTAPRTASLTGLQRAMLPTDDPKDFVVTEANMRRIEEVWQEEWKSKYGKDARVWAWRTATDFWPAADILRKLELKEAILTVRFVMQNWDDLQRRFFKQRAESTPSLRFAVWRLGIFAVEAKVWRKVAPILWARDDHYKKQKTPLPDGLRLEYSKALKIAQGLGLRLDHK